MKNKKWLKIYIQDGYLGQGGSGPRIVVEHRSANNKMEHSRYYYPRTTLFSSKVPEEVRFQNDLWEFINKNETN